MKETKKVSRGRVGLTDEQVALEIERLNASEYVALARREQRLKYAHRQCLYTLRQLEKRGKELAAAGITDEIIDDLFKEYGGKL